MNEVELAQARYDKAIKQIQKGLDARNGGPAAEAEAASAYQDLVRLGVASGISRKYSRGKALKQVR